MNPTPPGRWDQPRFTRSPTTLVVPSLDRLSRSLQGLSHSGGGGSVTWRFVLGGTHRRAGSILPGHGVCPDGEDGVRGAGGADRALAASGSRDIEHLQVLTISSRHQASAAPGPPGTTELQRDHLPWSQRCLQGSVPRRQRNSGAPRLTGSHPPAATRPRSRHRSASDDPFCSRAARCSVQLMRHAGLSQPGRGRCHSAFLGQRHARVYSAPCCATAPRNSRLGREGGSAGILSWHTRLGSVCSRSPCM